MKYTVSASSVMNCMIRISRVIHEHLFGSRLLQLGIPTREHPRGRPAALYFPAQMTARQPSNDPKWRYRRRPKHTSGRGLFLFGGVWFLPLGRSWARGCALWLRVNRGGIPRVLSTPAGGTSSLGCHSPATRGHPSPDVAARFDKDNGLDRPFAHRISCHLGRFIGHVPLQC